MNKFLLTCFLAFISSCSDSAHKKPAHETDEKFYYISGFSGDDVVYFVNGNPTNRGNAISSFIVEGDNEIELRGDFSDEGYYLKIIKTKNLFSQDFELVIDAEISAEEASKSSTHTFHSPSWWRWNWQDCDHITEITQKDKDQMLHIFDSICDSISQLSDDSKTMLQTTLSNPDIIKWSEHQYFTDRMEKMWQQIGSQMPPRNELILTKTPHAEMKFIAGRQIVMLIPTKAEFLFRLGMDTESLKPDSSGMTKSFYYGFQEMFFVKKGGEWKMMLPVN